MNIIKFIKSLDDSFSLKIVLIINIIIYVLMKLIIIYNCNLTYIYDVLKIYSLSDINTVLRFPISIFTYCFIHINFYHLVSNLTILFLVGNLFLKIFNNFHFTKIYLIGGFCGGIFYLILNKYLFDNKYYFLIGCSSSIYSLIYYLILYKLKIYLILFRVRIYLFILILLFFLCDLYSFITFNNVGGIISHVGGALFGGTYSYIYNFLCKKFDFDINSRFSKSLRYKYKNIFYKFINSGYECLSEEEKEILKKTKN